MTSRFTERTRRWVRSDDDEYLELESVPRIQYYITEDFIDEMREYNELLRKSGILLNSTYDPGSKKTIIKVFMIIDPITKDYHIAYTTKSVLRSLKMMVHQYLFDQPSALDGFGSRDITGLSVSLITVLRGKPNKISLRELKDIYADELQRHDRGLRRVNRPSH